MLAAIPSPPIDRLHVGPLAFHVYGLMYVVGITLAVVIARRRWRQAGGDPDLVSHVALWAVPAGLIGGRLYFDLTTPRFVPDHWWGPFAVWDGGLGIWGGIALATVVGVWRLRQRGVPVGAFMDAAVPGILVAQAVGRIGNYFNQELFGGPTSLPWALTIAPAHRPEGYAAFATFHPTFLYELVFDLSLAAALVWLGRHRRIRPPGLFALYVAGYSAFRIFEESLRIDPAQHLLGLRLNLYVAVALTVAGIAWFLALQRRTGPSVRGGGTLVAIGAACALAGCGGAGRAQAAGLPPTSSAPLSAPAGAAMSPAGSTPRPGEALSGGIGRAGAARALAPVGRGRAGTVPAP